MATQLPYTSQLSQHSFRESLRKEYDVFLDKQKEKYKLENCLKVDLHCHDLNSDVPDELWGRILGLPETWLKTKKLVKQLKKNNCDVITVTNHNNARSIWALKDKGYDVLSAAEFTCHFLEYELFLHVLAYGFTPEQEIVLNKKRKNVYEFLKYTTAQNIPVTLPHPLYFYTQNDHIDLGLFEKFAVMFQRFEVLNGQRDLWQSVLTLNWAQSLTADKIKAYAKKHDLNPADFGVDPDKPKILTGGSDDHTGIFAGECGSYLYVPDLQARLKTEKASDLALESIRNGDIFPFGMVSENQKLEIALLDYFSQISTKLEDPGLLRILLHRGELFDKAACFIISNLLLELQNHKTTNKFFKLVHDALHGKKPNKLLKWSVPKDYKICLKFLTKIAESKQQSPSEFVETVNASVMGMFTHMNHLITKRVKKITLAYPKKTGKFKLSSQELMKNIEIPSQLSALFFGSKQPNEGMSTFNFNQLLDNLTFPVFITLVVAGSTLASTRLLYQNRALLNRFADHIDQNKHPQKALYLTDTLRDKNGVSNSLSGKLKEIQRTDMEIDFLICHPDAQPEPHLHVVRPITTFEISDYGEQEFRIPNLLEIARIFYDGGYDRIVCSTEGPMALVSLFLKEMFNVPVFFFMHTDWMDFLKHMTVLNQHERDRIRRLMRLLYKRFDGIFVLNSDHRDWLTGHEMQLAPHKVFLTAHHTQSKLPAVEPINKAELFPDATENTPILFLACRLSKEKGIMDLPLIMEKVRQKIPDIKLVIAGSGPDKDALQALMPDTVFLGWVDKKRLGQLYLGLDLFIFPSQFDTFGNVILESFVHGMPVVSYNCKGPKDIIQNGVSGILVNDIEAFAESIIEYCQNETLQAHLSHGALARAADYRAQPIMTQFLMDLGLPLPQDYADHSAQLIKQPISITDIELKQTCFIPNKSVA